MRSCTRCDTYGFLNYEQIPAPVIIKGLEGVLEWVEKTNDHDVSVCDCCGNGEDWYGEAGWHYSSEDRSGKNGPYAYNGGLCECH